MEKMLDYIILALILVIGIHLLMNRNKKRNNNVEKMSKFIEQPSSESADSDVVTEELNENDTDEEDALNVSMEEDVLDVNMEEPVDMDEPVDMEEPAGMDDDLIDSGDLSGNYMLSDDLVTMEDNDDEDEDDINNNLVNMEDEDMGDFAAEESAMEDSDAEVEGSDALSDGSISYREVNSEDMDNRDLVMKSVLKNKYDSGLEEDNEVSEYSDDAIVEYQNSMLNFDEKIRNSSAKLDAVDKLNEMDVMGEDREIGSIFDDIVDASNVGQENCEHKNCLIPPAVDKLSKSKGYVRKSANGKFIRNGLMFETDGVQTGGKFYDNIEGYDNDSVHSAL
jgi:hypothetical protein